MLYFDIIYDSIHSELLVHDGWLYLSSVSDFCLFCFTSVFSFFSTLIR